MNGPDLQNASDLRPQPDGAGDEASLAPVAPLDPMAVLAQIDGVQRELDGLRGEIEQARRRDDTLSFYMQRLDEELRLAARLQQDFLPKSLPQLGRLQFHALFRPAGYVSGDLYDVMRLDERHVAFYVADAVGHGMPAALLTMFVKNALVTKDISADAARGYRLLDPSEALARLNAAMLAQNLSHASFVTAVYGIIDIERLEMRLARAGHPGPLLLRGDAAPTTIQPDGSLLGIFPDEQFGTATVQLQPGDRLLVYTDGIEIAFGEDTDPSGPAAPSDAPPPWQQRLIAGRLQPAESLLSDLAHGLDDTSGSLDPRDDLTLLVIDVAL